MSYSASVTVQTLQYAGDMRGLFVVTITETDASNTSETNFEVPKTFRIFRQLCKLTAGTGTTIDPVVGTVTDPGNASNSAELVYANGTAAVRVNNDINSGQGAACYASGGKLYHRSVPDAGSDNSITTIYLIQGGW